MHGKKIYSYIRTRWGLYRYIQESNENFTLCYIYFINMMSYYKMYSVHWNY